jgi:hypothetical protein
MPMKFIVPSLCIVTLTKLTNSGAIEKRLSYLVELEEDHFIPRFHQQVQKAHKKSWHEKHIKQKKFQMGDLVLLYDCFFAAPWKVPNALVGSVCDKICDRGKSCLVGEIEWGNHGRTGQW